MHRREAIGARQPLQIVARQEQGKNSEVFDQKLGTNSVRISCS